MTMTMADASTAAKPTSAQQCSQQKPSSATSSPMSSFLAGIAGGSASTILLYPLDLIKVRMQVDERPRYSAPNGTAAAAAAAHHEHPTSNSIDKPRTICTTVRGVIRHEGYVGLYRGLSPAIVGSAASWGGFFILYEEIKKQMLILKNNASSNSPLSISSGMNISINATISPEAQMQQPRLGPIDHFAASCLAGACMVALTNPLWLIKTRLQLQNSRLQNQISSPQNEASRKVKPAYRGMFHAAYTIVQEEGVLALYKGSVPALMLVSHGGIQFVTYEFLKGHFTTLMSNGKERRENELQRRQLTIGERLQDSLGYLVMGAMSKFVASTTTYPLQVLKARLQQRSQAIEVSETTGEIIITKREYSGVMDCIGKIYKNEGIYGFFKGCVTNAIRVAPSAAITFVTYEFVLDTLNGR